MRSAVIDSSSQPIRNLAVRGSAESSTALAAEGNGTGEPTRSTLMAHSGSYSHRFQWTVGNRGMSLSSAFNTNNSQVWNGYIPGRTYTVIVYVYSVSGTLPAFYVQNASYSSIPFTGINAASVSQTWQSIHFTFTAPAQGVGVRIYDIRNSEAEYFVDDIMLIEGNYLGMYANGEYPGWRWMGAMGNSESVGYPPAPDVRAMTLVSGPIAGYPTAPAGVWEMMPGSGPTGKPISRITRTENPVGWGLYTAAGHHGATISIGAVIYFSVWARSSIPSHNATFDVVNDNASEPVLTGRTATITQAWERFQWSRVVTQNTWPGGYSRKLRIGGTANTPGGWVELSDPVITVFNP